MPNHHHESVLKRLSFTPVASIFDRSSGPGASDQSKREEDNEDKKNDLDKRSNGLKPSEELVWEEEDNEADL